MRRSNMATLGWLGLGGVLAWLVLAPPGVASGLAAQTVPPPEATATMNNVGDIFGPIVLAATSVERLIEALWGLVEGVGGRALALLGLAASWARYAHDEVRVAQRGLHDLADQARTVEHSMFQARERVRQLVQQHGPQPTDPQAHAALATALSAAAAQLAQKSALDMKLTEAEDTLDSAQTKLRDALKSDTYVSAKKAVSVAAGLVLGLAGAFIGKLDLLQILHLTAHSTDGNGVTTYAVTGLGMALTGILIGTGSGPVHQVLGLVGQAQSFFNSRGQSTAAVAYSTLLDSKTQAAIVARSTPATPTTPPATGAEGEAGVVQLDTPAQPTTPPTTTPPATTPPATVQPTVTDYDLRMIRRLARG